MDTVKNLDDVVNVLSNLGYPVERQSECVSVMVGGSASPFPAIVTVDADALTVTCEVATKGNINSEVETDFLWGMVDLNTQICPYALAMISDGDIEEEWPIVLIDSMPIGDLSEEEMESSMKSLLSALITIKDLFQAGLKCTGMSEQVTGG